jgi:hypothetical protein
MNADEINDRDSRHPERGTTPRAWLFVREQSRAIVIWTRFSCSCSYSRSKGTANTLRIAGRLLCRVFLDACNPYEVWPIDYDYNYEYEHD